MRTFIDEFQIDIGQSLRERVDYGLERSRFAVVVLSPAFIQKGWTKCELSAIVALTADGKHNLLPIWLRITKDEIQAFSPLLTGCLRAAPANTQSLRSATRSLSATARSSPSSGSLNRRDGLPEQARGTCPPRRQIRGAIAARCGSLSVGEPGL